MGVKEFAEYCGKAWRRGLCRRSYCDMAVTGAKGEDSLGIVEVPEEAYWGCQTQRAIENFPISGFRHDPKFIDAFIMLKKAAAVARSRSGGGHAAAR